MIHRPYIRYSNDGSNKISDIRYYGKAGFHREAGPARIFYNNNGIIHQEQYWFKGEVHRDDGPAILYYYKDGNIQRERYIVHSKEHKIYGPSDIVYSPEDGRVICIEWHYKNIDYTLQVRKWLRTNDLYWKTMTESEYNQMWFEIL